MKIPYDKEKFKNITELEKIDDNLFLASAKNDNRNIDEIIKITINKDSSGINRYFAKLDVSKDKIAWTKLNIEDDNGKVKVHGKKIDECLYCALDYIQSVDRD